MCHCSFRGAQAWAGSPPADPHEESQLGPPPLRVLRAGETPEVPPPSSPGCQNPLLEIHCQVLSKRGLQGMGLELTLGLGLEMLRAGVLCPPLSQGVSLPLWGTLSDSQMEGLPRSRDSRRPA